MLAFPNFCTLRNQVSTRRVLGDDVLCPSSLNLDKKFQKLFCGDVNNIEPHERCLHAQTPAGQEHTCIRRDFQDTLDASLTLDGKLKEYPLVNRQPRSQGGITT